MAISSIFGGSAAHGASALNKKSTLQQHSTDFSNLAGALGSNNLTSAQNAFSALQKDAQSIPATPAGSPANAQSLQQVKNDAQTLATTLAAGNLGAAAVTSVTILGPPPPPALYDDGTLKQDSASARMHFHHHGGGARVAGSASASSTTASSSELLATQAIGSVGSTLNVTA